MKYLRLLLFPFSLLYALVVTLRNWCYDAGWFKSEQFNLPVISVGNLTVGGAGKSPMTEYLVRLFKSEYSLATLSRGYGRKTEGFIIADTQAAAETIGDEPAQFKQKFPEVIVAVCEKRADGIRRLQADHNLIILDDAYQHRAVTPGFSILLMEYGRLKEPHLLLPAGNLRELFSGRSRADVIVVSKCPPELNKQQQMELLPYIKPLPHQQVYFTSIAYQPLQSLSTGATIAMPGAGATVFLLTGIANIKPLLQYIRQHTPGIILHNYPDHHQFTLKNITKLADDFNRCTSISKLIITTEKDAQRLKNEALMALLQPLPIYVLPIGIQFLNQAAEQFNITIKNYVREHTTYHRLY
ncbi:tetraacyldisaccharide 4'-kinase [Mucilaginibacter koreensis]